MKKFALLLIVALLPFFGTATAEVLLYEPAMIVDVTAFTGEPAEPVALESANTSVMAVSLFTVALIVLAAIRKNKFSFASVTRITSPTIAKKESKRFEIFEVGWRSAA